MTRRLCVPLAALLCLLALAGCRVLSEYRVTTDLNAEEFSKAQKIVVTDDGGTERAVLTEEADIEAFVEAMDITRWHIADLPEGLTPSGTVTLHQTETVTALIGEREAEVQEICTLQCYEGGDYLTLDLGFFGAAITFSIPPEAADYLSSFWG